MNGKVLQDTATRYNFLLILENTSRNTLRNSSR